MLYAVSLATYLARATLEDYGGSSYSIIHQGLIALAIFSIPAYVGWLLWRRYKKVAFHRLCAEELSPEELGFIKNFLRRFHVRQPLAIITSRGSFDHFMNRVSHHYENAHLSEEDLFREAMAIKGVRRSLSFTHQYREQRLLSSRCLPVNHPITVIFTDASTHRTFTFHSKIIHNHDFFLGIEPPDSDISKEVFSKKKQSLQITFTRENDAIYHFDSVIARIVNYPTSMWYIRHSQALPRGEPHRLVALPATVMIGKGEGGSEDKDEGGEHAVTISSFTKEGCRFRFDNKATTLEPPANILLNISIEDTSQLLRGLVSSQMQRRSKTYYRMRFSSIDKEQRSRIRRFVNSLLENPNPPTQSQSRTPTPQKSIGTTP